MSSAAQWREIKYRQTFEEELRGLRRRKEANPSLSCDDIKGTLKHLYIMDGADQGGRGEVQDLTLAATIAAYELFLEEWGKTDN